MRYIVTRKLDSGGAAVVGRGQGGSLVYGIGHESAVQLCRYVDAKWLAELASRTMSREQGQADHFSVVDIGDQ